MNPITPFTGTYIPVRPTFHLERGTPTDAARALNAAWHTRDRLRLALFLFGGLEWMPIIGPAVARWTAEDEHARAEIGVLTAYA